VRPADSRTWSKHIIGGWHQWGVRRTTHRRSHRRTRASVIAQLDSGRLAYDLGFCGWGGTAPCHQRTCRAGRDRSRPGARCTPEDERHVISSWLRSGIARAGRSRSFDARTVVPSGRREARSSDFASSWRISSIANARARVRSARVASQRAGAHAESSGRRRTRRSTAGLRW